jgi:hypothetical protein
MQIIRPGGESDNLPTITLGTGQTFVTWSSPRLELRAGAPAVAPFDVPVQVVANVSNPGDQAATNVRVDLRLPPGTRVTSADGFARVLPNAVTWEIGTVPAQQQLDLFLEIAAQSTVDLVFQARGDGLVDEAAVRIDVFRPSLSIKATPVQERIEAGERITFNIDVTNTGDRPLQNLALAARGDTGMIHEGGGKAVAIDRRDGALQPGQTWGAQVVFVPTESGLRCVDFEATADGGQRATGRGCVTAINPVPKTPRLTATLESPTARIAVGELMLARAILGNSGQGPARNVRVTMVYDPQLQLVEATQGADASRAAQNVVTWTIPVIEPGRTVPLEGRFNAIRINPRARIAITAESEEGSLVNQDLFLEIVAATAPPATLSPPVLPPAQPTPEVPGGPAVPLQGAPQAALPPVAAVPISPPRSEQLQVQLFGRDNPVRVNDPIRYRMRIFNDSDSRDGQVEIQFELPAGVRLERVAQLANPEAGEFRVDAGVVRLAEIRSMNPGESAEYELVLSSNQPQTFDLRVQVRSTRAPNGVVQFVTTNVVP